MKVKALMVVLVSSFMIIIGATQISAHSQSKEELKKFYETRIVNKIDKCQLKTMLKTSRSENLQLTAQKAANQARFLSLNKDMLVNEMIEKVIGQKTYKIELKYPKGRKVGEIKSSKLYVEIAKILGVDNYKKLTGEGLNTLKIRLTMLKNKK